MFKFKIRTTFVCRPISVWFLEDDRRFNISEDALTATRNSTQENDAVFVVICDNFDITGIIPGVLLVSHFRTDTASFVLM